MPTADAAGKEHANASLRTARHVSAGGDETPVHGQGLVRLLVAVSFTSSG